MCHMAQTIKREIQHFIKSNVWNYTCETYNEQFQDKNEITKMFHVQTDSMVAKLD